MATTPRSFVAQQHQLMHSAVYTVVPVVGHRLLDLPFHVHRLHESFSLLESQHGRHGGVDAASVRSDFLAMLGGLAEEHARDGALAPDALLTVCYGRPVVDGDAAATMGRLWYATAGSLFASVGNSGPSALNVDLQPYERQTDPRVKPCSWPAERAPLEETRSRHGGAAAAETLIYTVADGERARVTEGLTSNLFVLDAGGGLVTPPEGAALSGSMARCVVATALTLGVPVERRCPEVEVAGGASLPPALRVPWRAAFVTSATKALVPIAAVHNDPSWTSGAAASPVYAALRAGLDTLLRPGQLDMDRAAAAALGRIIPYPMWSPPITDPAFIPEVEALLRDAHPHVLI